MEDTFLIPLFEFFEVYLNEIFDESQIEKDNEPHKICTQEQSQEQSYMQQIKNYILNFYCYN